MVQFKSYDDIGVSTESHVATIEIQRPPHNFFDYSLIQQIVDAMETIDEDKNLRCVVLCAQGKSFCAGANFGSDGLQILLETVKNILLFSKEILKIDRSLIA